MKYPGRIPTRTATLLKSRHMENPRTRYPPWITNASHSRRRVRRKCRCRYHHREAQGRLETGHLRHAPRYLDLRREVVGAVASLAKKLSRSSLKVAKRRAKPQPTDHWVAAVIHQKRGAVHQATHSEECDGY